MSVGEEGLAVGEEAGPVDESELGLAQSLRARERRLLRLAAEEVGGERARRGGLDGPVRDQQGAGAGVEERAA